MGSFYGNVTLVGTSLDAVRAACPRPAFAFAEGDTVVVFAAEDDQEVPSSAARLSAELDCLAFSAGVHDDDIFCFAVHDRGRSVTTGCVPDPLEYFGVDAEMLADLDPSMLEGTGGGMVPGSGPPDPDALVEALGRGDVDAVRTAFAADFDFASERHEAIAAALGLPTSAAGWGYRYLERERRHYKGPPLVTL